MNDERERAQPSHSRLKPLLRLEKENPESSKRYVGAEKVGARVAVCFSQASRQSGGKGCRVHFSVARALKKHARLRITFLLISATMYGTALRTIHGYTCRVAGAAASDASECISRPCSRYLQKSRYITSNVHKESVPRKGDLIGALETMKRDGPAREPQTPGGCPQPHLHSLF